MARLNRIGPPPSSVTGELRTWLWQVYDAINGQPAASIFSGDPNTSGQTADAGTIGVNLASGSTQRLWVNTSGQTSSWSYLNYA